MGRCPSCGKEVDNESKFCPHCGADLRLHLARPRSPDYSRERTIALAVVVCAMIALALFALWLPGQFPAASASVNPTYTETESTYYLTGASINVSNSTLTYDIPSSSPSNYSLSFGVTNTGSVNMIGLQVIIMSQKEPSQSISPSCTFNPRINPQVVAPGVLVDVTCGVPMNVTPPYQVFVNGIFADGAAATWSGTMPTSYGTNV